MPNNNQSDIDLSGKTIIVTGANAGIGKVAARELAGMGALVIMVARSRERGEKALQEVRSASGETAALPRTSATPLLLSLQEGDYSVTIRGGDGSDQVLNVTVVRQRRIDARADFGAMDADRNDDESAWCASVSSYGAGDLGTPGDENDSCR